MPSNSTFVRAQQKREVSVFYMYLKNYLVCSLHCTPEEKKILRGHAFFHEKLLNTDCMKSEFRILHICHILSLVKEIFICEYSEFHH
jgi:hypothetical protein